MVGLMTDEELESVSNQANAALKITQLDEKHVFAGIAPLPAPGYSLLYRAYAEASCLEKPVSRKLCDIFTFSPLITIVTRSS